MSLSEVFGKKAKVVPIYKRGDRSLVSNCRPVSLTSVVCKQMEHVTASYLRKIWDKKDWLFKGRTWIEVWICMRKSSDHGLHIADPLDNEAG
jgi:hypothetical protein